MWLWQFIWMSVIQNKVCECGHGWFNHHWDNIDNQPESCFNCKCSTYSEKGKNSFWIVKMYYDMEHPHTHKALRDIRTWIGEDIRDERRKKRTRPTQ